MKDYQKLIEELNAEISQLKSELSQKTDQLDQKDELLATYWETIQSLRLTSRLKKSLGVFWFQKIRNYTYANGISYRQKNEQVSLSIKIAAPDWLNARFWGDYHFATSLRTNLVKLGYHVVIQVYHEWEDNVGFDVVIVLRGPKRYMPNKGQFNIMWNISHPQEISYEEYSSYDQLLIASNPYAETLSINHGNKVMPLLQCSDTTLFYPTSVSKNNQIVFVGNSHGLVRPIVGAAIRLNYDISVYGKDWQGLIDEKYIRGDHIPNRKLKHVYSRSSIVLNDHWPDMRNLGFISNRIFDVLACNGTIISDSIHGIPEELKKFIHIWDGSLKNLEQNIILNKTSLFANESNSIIRNDHNFENRTKIIDELIKN